jgi:3-methyladenine DNA glycosylase AlkD
MSGQAAAATDLLSQITAALEAVAEPEFRAKQQGYSKEPILSLGVRTPVMRQIAQDFWPRVKDLPIDALLGQCEALLQTGTVEHRCIALAWAYKQRRALQPAHFEVLYGWLCRHVADWAACDQLCCEVFGDFMKRYPQYAVQVRAWVQSENRWLRRAAAVVLIPDLRDDAHFLPLILEVATVLLPDRDDLVQKGYGWALKTAVQTRPLETWAFILQHKKEMSRTALRYAIEKLSPAQKAEAMKS